MDKMEKQERVNEVDNNPTNVNFLEESAHDNNINFPDNEVYTWDYFDIEKKKQQQGKDIITFIEQQMQNDTPNIVSKKRITSKEILQYVQRAVFIVENDENGILIRDTSTNEIVPYVFNSEELRTHENLCIQQTAITIDGIIERGWDNKFNIITKLDELDRKIYVECTNWEEHIGAAARGSLMWTPEGGIVTEQGGRQSPALGLFHELAEVYFELFDPLGMMAEEPELGSEDYLERIYEWNDRWYNWAKRDDPENIKKWTPSDRWIIEEVEPLAQQAIRNSHTYLEKYKAQDTFSLEGATQSEIKLVDKIKNALKKVEKHEE